ncbi:acyl transferase domain-containing protein [Paenibacillus rhizosphaerae]|uniref:Acyl transferase domain-containing protein n=1 Tax=Paenibacillus rhizosphaerae TaxID=297318 RepID=A0A839TNQ1_9BACL|nr:acyltransferase domain-containing protein [Paenibacillus rhizosphaerae]MBB3126989.1 acyl transferase domain-containing protein [Paenibacillus rhizosphaerae]
MAKPVVFLFPGQGSQYYRMGIELYERHPGYREWMDRMDRRLYPSAGRSVVMELYGSGRKAEEPLDHLSYSHPAIFMVEYALAQVMMENGIYPDIVLGTSLGEFASCAVAGVIDWETALKLAAAQADVVQHTCEPGGMIAIASDPAMFGQTAELYTHTELAAVNDHSHFVVSGAAEGILQAEAFLRQNRIAHQVLPVRYGFHSASIDAAEAAYKPYLNEIHFNRPQVKLVSGLYGMGITSLSSDYAWDAVRHPIRFLEAMQRLNPSEHICVDLGPSGTLANFTKHLWKQVSGAEVYSVLSPFQKDWDRLQATIRRIQQA